MTKVKDKPVTVDLKDILSQEVYTSSSAPVLSAEDTAPEAVLTEEPEQVVLDTFHAPGTNAENRHSDTSYEQEPEPEPQSLSADDMATIGVNMLDGIQRFAFAWMHKKSVFTESELEILGSLDPTGNTVYTPPNSQEAIAAVKLKKHLEFIQTLPFDAGEKQRLTDATKIYLRTTQVKVSPFTGLILAYSEVLGMRAINTFSE